MHPSLGATAPVGLRVAGLYFYSSIFTALPGTFLPKTRHCHLHSFPKLGGSKLTLTCRELIDAFSIDMNLKKFRRALHMYEYMHVPATIWPAILCLDRHGTFQTVNRTVLQLCAEAPFNLSYVTMPIKYPYPNRREHDSSQACLLP